MTTFLHFLTGQGFSCWVMGTGILTIALLAVLVEIARDECRARQAQHMAEWDKG